MNCDFRQECSDWLDKHLWPQIFAMMAHDAYFKLMGHARKLTGQFNDPIGWFINAGFVTYQVMAIRRLCDNRKGVISLRRLLVKAGSKQRFRPDRINELSRRLDDCDHVCHMANNYIAHTTNPLQPHLRQWNLLVADLTKAQKAICEVAVTINRDTLQRGYPDKIIPVPQGDIMKELNICVPENDIPRLWDFWHEHNRSVNAWIPRS